MRINCSFTCLIKAVSWLVGFVCLFFNRVGRLDGNLNIDYQKWCYSHWLKMKKKTYIAFRHLFSALFLFPVTYILFPGNNKRSSASFFPLCGSSIQRWKLYFVLPLLSRISLLCLFQDCAFLIFVAAIKIHTELLLENTNLWGHECGISKFLISVSILLQSDCNWK